MLNWAFLLDSPHIFPTTYQSEATRPRSAWISRLMNPARHTLICVAHDANYRSQGLQSERWAGTFDILGPLSKEEYVMSGSTVMNLGSVEEETRWHVTGLFLQPVHRRKEAGIQMGQAPLDFVRSYTEEHRPSICTTTTTSDIAPSGDAIRFARLRGPVRPGTILDHFLKAIGASEAGWITLPQAMKANGDVEWIPSQQSHPELHSQRSIPLMEGMIVC